MSLSTEDDLLVELLDELMAAVRDGKKAPIEEVCGRHPELATRLRELFSTMCMMEQHKPSWSTDQRPVATKPPIQIADYQILREVGRGGMGVVYEAEQLSLGRRVALKVMSPGTMTSLAAVARFRREARSAAQLHHSNIVPVFEVGEDSETHFYTMQFIDGCGLDQVLMQLRARRSGDSSAISTTLETSSIDPESSHFRSVARIGLQLAEALTYAHSHGTIHRDIKPSNILIDSSGAAWITDFGLAKCDSESENEEQSSLTLTGQVVGTLRYLAPERLNGQHTVGGDVYSLGATLFELLAFSPMYDESDRLKLMEQIRQGRHVQLRKQCPRIPRDLETIICKAVRSDPGLRYRDAQTLADDLRLFLLDRPIKARRTRASEHVLRWCRKNRALTATLVALTTVFGLLVIGRFVYLELAERHRKTVELLRRTESAEHEANAFARLREVSRYRQTGLSGLADRLSLLRVETKDLGDTVRQELRNEWLSCMARADWNFTTSIPCESAVAALGPSGTLIAEATGHQQIQIRSVVGSSVNRITPTLNMNIAYMRFSEKGEYLVATDTARAWQVIRVADGSVVFPVTQAAEGCTVNEDSDLVAFWHLFPIVHLKSLKLEDAGSELRQIATQGGSVWCEISPGGEYVAVLNGVNAGERQLLSLFRCGDGALVDQHDTGDGTTLAWSPDGKRLAIPDRHGVVAIRMMPSFELMTNLVGNDDVVSAMKWHPSGNYLITSSWNGRTCIWNAWSGRQLVRNHDSLSEIAFSQNGRRIGWRSQPGSLQIAEWSSGEVTDLPWGSYGDQNLVNSFAISEDSQFVVGCSYRGFQLFDAETETCLARIDTPGTLTAAFGSKGQRLIVLTRASIQHWPINVTASNGVRRMKLGPPRIAGMPEIVNGIIQNDAMTAIVRTTLSPDTMARVQLDDGTLLQHSNEVAPGLDIYRPGRGNLLVKYGWLAPQAEVFDSRSFQHLATLDIGVNSMPSGSDDGQYFLTASSRILQFWNTATWQKSSTVPLDAPVVGPIASFHPDESLFSVRLMPSRMGVINPASLQVVARIDELQDVWSKALSYSPDGRILLEATTTPSAIRIWHFERMRRKLAVLGLDWSTPLPPSKFSDLPPRPIGDPLIVEVDSETVNPLPETVSIEQLRKQLLTDPENPQLQNNLAWQLLMAPDEHRSNEEALSLARKSVAALGTPYSRNTLALACYRNHLFDESLEILTSNLPASEQSDLTLDLVLLSMVTHQLHQPDQSMGWMVRAENNFEAHPPARDSVRKEIIQLMQELHQLQALQKSADLKPN